MARIELPALTQWITTAAQQHGDDLPAQLMARLSIGRRAASNLLARLVEAQWLLRDDSAPGARRKPVYRPGVLKQVVCRYPLAGLQEDLPWSRDFGPYFDLAPNVLRIARHAFTELVNNAIDHSGGSQVTVSVRQTAMHLQMLVSDDGCGVFDSLQRSFEIADPQLAMIELCKGKLTSQPDRHCGQGLFFTSRLADVFDLHANQQAFQHRGWGSAGWYAGKPMARQGSSIFFGLALESTRTLDEVLRAHSADGAGYGFEATSVPLRLLAGPEGALESRAQAKRVASRLQQFRRVEVDFSGVDDVGPAFADELFRVFSRSHPGLEMQPVGMAPRVAAMIASVRQAAH
ncbi:MAG TPA: DUF4325 domain-containing protein [Ideonella sp.]|nr:DUF4325 domain-containing protein [Ideonella sp.]